MRPILILAIVINLFACIFTLAAPATQPAGDQMIGMYVHQHWPYKHPYAARTWTYEDWRGYVGALKKLGYNTIIIWPVLDTMPEPPTPSDREHLDKLGRVINTVRNEMGMRVYLTLAPNVIADDAVAGQATFQERHFFHSDIRVNPADEEAMDRMIRRRERQMKPLAAADGVLIIDSDPGGYPNSTNPEFIRTLQKHREMFDRLRPGIELVYWVWAGWPAYCRHYAVETFEWGKPEEFVEALTLLKNLNPEPWGIAYGLEHAQKAGVASRVINLQYGAIEGEPSWPLTNFSVEGAWKAGGHLGPRGIIGNAQTHCVQLPNTLAFVRGAQGRPAGDADYTQFANDLITGRGELIVEGWKSLWSGDPARMRAAADKLEALSTEKLTPGELQGLLFGDPNRFVLDLVSQLRYMAALYDLHGAVTTGGDRREPLGRYIAGLEAWYGRHGYQNFWVTPEVIAKLDSPEVNEVLNPRLDAKTPYGRVKENYYRKETFTPQLIAALRNTRARYDAQPTTQQGPAAK